MPISAVDLKMYRSVQVSDLASNGGLMGSVEAVSAAASNVFPNASSAERENGSTVFRKLFFKVANSSNLALLNARVWQDSNTAGDDTVVFFPSTQRQTQGSIPISPQYFGCAKLDTTVLAGATSLTVLVDPETPSIFRDGDLVRVTNRETPDSAGVEEWVRISGIPSVVGNLITIGLASPLQNQYLASASKVSSVYEYGTVQATADSAMLTSVGGSLVSPESNIVARAVGGIEQNWTLTFTSPTAYTIEGDTVGNVGAGNISAGASPVNAAFNSPYFVINPALFGGVFAAGNVLTFSTHPAAIPVFLKRIIPAGTQAHANNTASFYIDGETS